MPAYRLRDAHPLSVYIIYRQRDSPGLSLLPLFTFLRLSFRLQLPYDVPRRKKSPKVLFRTTPYMPRKANFIFDVRIRISEAFTLDSIVRSPRTFKPKDVLSACQNNELELKLGDPPAAVVSLATYMMTDFFAMAHATGLYNRQRSMWESLSKVNSIHVNQLSVGLLKKEPIPVFDFSFQDYKGKPLIAVLLVASLPEKQSALALLKGFISRYQGKSSLTGALACYPTRFPDEIRQYLLRQTDTADQIGKYESILPALRVPFDLLEMNEANLLQLSQESAEGAELRTVFQLVHPDLKKGRTDHPAPRAWTRKKTAVSEETEGVEITSRVDSLAAEENGGDTADDQHRQSLA